jgi:hypothetical protein
MKQLQVLEISCPDFSKSKQEPIFAEFAHVVSVLPNLLVASASIKPGGPLLPQYFADLKSASLQSLTLTSRADECCICAAALLSAHLLEPLMPQLQSLCLNVDCILRKGDPTANWPKSLIKLDVGRAIRSYGGHGVEQLPDGLKDYFWLNQAAMAKTRFGEYPALETLRCSGPQGRHMQLLDPCWSAIGITLKSLEISNWNNASTLIEAVLFCKHLTRVSFFRCDGVDASLLKALSRTTQSLETLSLTCCYNLRGKKVILGRFIRSQPRLRRLWIDESSGWYQALHSLDLLHGLRVELLDTKFRLFEL